MRAVAITGERRAEVVDIGRPVPGPGEVLLDVSFCGICGSDLHMLAMPAGMFPAGHVLGHEFTGVVAGLGSAAGQWRVGDRVAVLPIADCGECYACRAGHPNLCEQGIDHGPGIGRPGGYAESVTVPTAMLHRLPDSVSDADGALIEPLAVALRAVKLSQATPGEPVCVLGAGPIGVLALAALRARGFSRVAVVEPVAGRRAAAARLGVPAGTSPRLFGTSPRGGFPAARSSRRSPPWTRRRAGWPIWAAAGRSRSRSCSARVPVTPLGPEGRLAPGPAGHPH
jgi:(R,R)-butanediol dehydrogenase/meso-butanediol dehydrogenase/diacetyl reductase